MIYGSDMNGATSLVEVIGHIKAVKVFIQHLAQGYLQLEVNTRIQTPFTLSVQILTIADNEVCNQF